VTGACLIVRKDLYLRVGGLDEGDLAEAFNDVDFCLKLRQLGYRCVWTPHAELYYDEPPRSDDDASPERSDRLLAACDAMLRRWKSELAYDPAYSPNLTLEREDFSPAFPPRIKKPW
jgi:hypothetical protein